MSYPILAPTDTWYTKGDSGILRSSITEIEFKDSYQPTSSPTAQWDGSANNDSSITVYVEGTRLIIAGNGSGGIYANENSEFAFSDSSSTATDPYASLTTITNIHLLRTERVTSMYAMFAFAAKLQNLDVSHFNVSNVESLRSTFYGCSTLTQLEVSNWDVSSCTTLRKTFTGCSGIKLLDVSNWGTARCTDMSYTFHGCSSLQLLELLKWDTSACTNMSYMFYGCTTLQQLDLHTWDVSKVTNMSGMFASPAAKNGQGSTGKMTSIDVSNWNVSSCTTMSSMFSSQGKLTYVPIETWTGTSSCTNMGWMFWTCSSLRSIDLSNFDTSNVVSFHHLFAHDSALTEIKGLADLDVSRADTLNAMLHSTRISSLDVSKWNTSNCNDFSQFVGYCSALTEIIGLDRIDTSNARGFNEMFNDCSKLKVLDLSNMDTTKAQSSWVDPYRGSAAGGLQSMFTGMTRLETIIVGPNFSFVDIENKEYAILPTPSTAQIPNTLGKWKSESTLRTYTGNKDMPNLVYDVYHCVPFNVEVLTDSDTCTDIAQELRTHLRHTHPISLRDVPNLISQAVQDASKGISFTSNNAVVLLKLKGSGPVNVFINDEIIDTVVLSDSWTEIELRQSAAPYTLYQINNTDRITELDLSSQEVTTFTANVYCGLVKLAIHNNSICKLDLTTCPKLQYLHMHNNPICDEDTYRTELEICMRSLPDRAQHALGSILLYPWYGLETLICKDESGEYIKYPTGHAELVWEQDKLYGEVVNNSITYYTYQGDTLVEHTAMNRHHTLRKQLEADITLVKNWMFGSAIQYEDDYKCCPYYFTEVGVQHVWETAEKGFGMCIGSIDQFTGRAYKWEEMNVRGYYNRAGTPLDPSSSNTTLHGDKILSQIVGRGELVYGICPNAEVFTVHVSGGSWESGMKLLVDNNCTSLTFSYSFTGNANIRLYLGKFGENNIITESACNGGDGRPWTYEENQIATAFGNYGTNDDPSSTENHSTTFFVAALTPTRAASVFSNSSTNADKASVGGFTPEDFIGHYGEQIAVAQSDGLHFIQGTSMSSPNCNATLSLMRIIYSKLHPECTSFGKGSEFMEYVKSHWMDHLCEYMSFSVGLGMPCFNVEPATVLVESDPPRQVTYLDSTQLGVPFRVTTAVSEGCKSGLTFGHSYSDFAQLGQDRLVPIRQDVKQFYTYTNTAIKGAGHRSTGAAISYAANYKQDVVSLESCIRDNLLLEMKAQDKLIPCSIRTINDAEYVTTESSVTEFTLQFALKLSADQVGADVPDTEGQYQGSWVWLHKSNAGAATQVLITLCEVIVTIDPNTGDVIKRAIVPDTYKYMDGNTEKTDETLLAYRGSRISATVASQYRLGIREDEVFVVTLTFDRNSGVGCYYNGNLLNKIIVDPEDIVRASDLIIKRTKLINDSIDDVLFYNKVLSHEDIINNTILLLNKER